MKRFMIATATALGLMMLAIPSAAQDETDEMDDACVSMCREAHHDCRFDVREEADTCREDAGCDALRDEYRETCFTDERDDEACSEARTAYRECKEPCRDAAREAADACREEARACFTDECGIEKPRGRGNRGRRPRGFGRGFRR